MKRSLLDQYMIAGISRGLSVYTILDNVRRVCKEIGHVRSPNPYHPNTCERCSSPLPPPDLPRHVQALTETPPPDCLQYFINDSQGDPTPDDICDACGRKRIQHQSACSVCYPGGVNGCHDIQWFRDYCPVGQERGKS